MTRGVGRETTDAVDAIEVGVLPSAGCKLANMSSVSEGRAVKRERDCQAPCSFSPPCCPIDVVSPLRWSKSSGRGDCFKGCAVLRIHRQPLGEEECQTKAVPASA